MKQVFVVKRKSDGAYFSASTSASKAPTVYATAGKAEGRRKTLDVERQGFNNGFDYQRWEVKRWKITEDDGVCQMELVLPQ